MALQSTVVATLFGALYVAGVLPGAQHPPFGPAVRRLHGELVGPFGLADTKNVRENLMHKLATRVPRREQKWKAKTKTGKKQKKT